MANLQSLLTSEQAASALLALRRDKMRELKAELDELKSDEKVIENYIQQCYDDK